MDSGSEAVPPRILEIDGHELLAAEPQDSAAWPGPVLHGARRSDTV